MKPDIKRGALAVLLALGAASALGAEAPTNFDGLVPIPGAKADMAYVDPDADFSVFRQVTIVDPSVAFRANWERDQNRSRSRNLRSADVERIKADVAHLLREVFIERLEAAGYHITTETGEDVLVVRPAIIDLDITAPDLKTAGRTRTYTTTNGAATLYIELYDAMSGDIIGRAADRRVARHAGDLMTWNNRVTNSAEARRMFGRWADQLVAFLSSYDVKPGTAEQPQQGGY
jgi:hypothetical protein